MTGAPHLFEGGCHCGNIAFLFEASKPLDSLGLRACLCSFCRKHGARTTSDPHGSVKLHVRNEAKLARYRFGLKTADFLVCADCGVYVGAVLRDGGQSWMTVNANAFDDPPELGHHIVPHSFDHERSEARVARRKANWTPVTEINF